MKEKDCHISASTVEKASTSVVRISLPEGLRITRRDEAKAREIRPTFIPDCVTRT